MPGSTCAARPSSSWSTIPTGETPGLTGPFNGRAMTYYGRWTYKFEEAARQGAAAAIIVHDTEPAAYGWNVVQSSWTGAQQVADAADGNADQIAGDRLDPATPSAKALFAQRGPGSRRADRRRQAPRASSAVAARA